MSFHGSSGFLLELAEVVACFEKFGAACGVEAADDAVFEVDRRGPLRFLPVVDFKNSSALLCSDPLLDEIVTESESLSPSATRSGLEEDAEAAAPVRIKTSACAAACRRRVARTSVCSTVTTDFELEADPRFGDSVRSFFVLGFFGREVEDFEIVDVNGTGFPRDAGFGLIFSAFGGATGVLSSSNAPYADASGDINPPMSTSCPPTTSGVAPTWAETGIPSRFFEVVDSLG